MAKRVFLVWRGIEERIRPQNTYTGFYSVSGDLYAFSSSANREAFIKDWRKIQGWAKPIAVTKYGARQKCLGVSVKAFNSRLSSLPIDLPPIT